MDGTTATAREIPPPLQMLQLISGFWIARCIYVLAKLGLADLIKDEPKTSDDLAAETGTHGPSLFRVLRALASMYHCSMAGTVSSVGAIVIRRASRPSESTAGSLMTSLKYERVRFAAATSLAMSLIFS